MPEKYVLFCANDSGRGLAEWLVWPLVIFLPAADLCGTAALIVGAVHGTLPPALAVGYSVATLGWVAFAAFLIRANWYRQRQRGAAGRLGRRVAKGGSQNLSEFNHNMELATAMSLSASSDGDVAHL